MTNNDSTNNHNTTNNDSINNHNIEKIQIMIL